MIGLYLGALLFGGILIGASLLLGGGDSDADHDVAADHEIAVDHDVDHDVAVDHDVDHDVAVDKDVHLPHAEGAALYWLPFLSLRFWTFGAAAFGFVGVALHYFLPWLLTLALALLTGLVVGTGTATLFRQLRRDTVSADVGLARLVGQEARVLLPVRPGGTGKIVIEASDGRVELLARTRDEAAIEPGARVLVASIDQGTADVTSLTTNPAHSHRIGVRASD
jgi:membrane protein implicated in regulation of membrane protease activity